MAPCIDQTKHPLTHSLRSLILLRDHLQLRVLSRATCRPDQPWIWQRYTPWSWKRAGLLLVAVLSSLLSCTRTLNQCSECRPYRFSELVSLDGQRTGVGGVSAVETHTESTEGRGGAVGGCQLHEDSAVVGYSATTSRSPRSATSPRTPPVRFPETRRFLGALALLEKYPEPHPQHSHAAPLTSHRLLRCCER